ncbi:hypothetical protein RDV89_17065 [Nocardioides zeae]|uniref:Secreted protein n=1 Tax=Nocardioides imazamoxiresistens TaxID=3231893 RepID=A0ABU3Q114_9ACTN|nr:hypothetical protein [Nocardioides zeae]MDT9594801.1 hypothetical protein [Nocardioides zeae]
MSSVSGRGEARKTGLRPWHVLVLLAVALVALSAAGDAFGRAEPTGSYRPALPGDTLADGCYPLPGGAVPDVPYVVRTDGDVATPDGERRHLVLHWSLVDIGAALDGITAPLVDVGYDLTEQAVRGDTATARLVLPGSPDADVAVTLRAFGDDPEVPDPIVRGRAELDLPSTPRVGTAAVCDWPSTTKRFPASDG